MKNHFHNKGWALNLVFDTGARGNSEMAYYDYLCESPIEPCDLKLS